MKLFVRFVLKKELNACSTFLSSRKSDVSCVSFLIEKLRNILMLISLWCKWYSLIYIFRRFDKISLKQKKIIRSKKKTIKPIKKIVKIVSLSLEIFSLISKSFVVVTEFFNSMMNDALKRFNFFFVDFKKRQILSFFVVSFSFFFYINESSSLIAFLFFELI